VRIEAGFPPPAPAREVDAPASAKRWLALVVLIAAIGTQVHTAILSKPVYVRLAGADADWYLPAFWLGFAFALPLAVLVARGRSPLSRASLALLGGAAALVAVQHAPTLGTVVAAQLLAGAAWGVLATVVVTCAIALGGAGRAGTAAGMVFAALAAAALTRLGLVALGVQSSAAIAWIPVVAWLAAGALTVARARATEALLSIAEVRSVRATPA